MVSGTVRTLRQKMCRLLRKTHDIPFPSKITIELMKNNDAFDYLRFMQIASELNEESPTLVLKNAMDYPRAISIVNMLKIPFQITASGGKVTREVVTKSDVVWYHVFNGFDNTEIQALGDIYFATFKEKIEKSRNAKKTRIRAVYHITKETSKNMEFDLLKMYSDRNYGELAEITDFFGCVLFIHPSPFTEPYVYNKIATDNTTIENIIENTHCLTATYSSKFVRFYPEFEYESEIRRYYTDMDFARIILAKECTKAWNHMYITTRGDVYFSEACPRGPIGNLKDYKNLKEMWNSTVSSNLRKEIISKTSNKGCEMCTR